VTCEALINTFLLDYLAGTLSAARRLDFQVHLTLCSACRKYVSSYRRTIELARDAGLEAPHAPEDPPAELVEAILKITRSGG
jgi:anti-sigma factor RsiW